MKLSKEGLDLFQGHLRSYHIRTDRPDELVADSSAEWDDLDEIRRGGGLASTTLAEDRHAVIFPNPQAAREALEELRDTSLA